MRWLTRALVVPGLMLGCSQPESDSVGPWAPNDTGVATTVESTTNPRLAMTQDGSGCLVWVEASTPNRLMAMRYATGTGWSASEVVAESALIHSADVEISESGELIAVWQNTEADTARGLFSRYTAASGWGAAELLDSEVETCDGCSSGAGHFALDGDGSGLALWSFWDSTKATLRAGSHAPGAGWMLVEETEIDQPLWASVAIRDAHRAAFVWTVRGSADQLSDLWFQQFDIADGWAAPERLASDQVDTFAPRALLDGSGAEIVTWTHDDGLYATRRQQGGAWSEAERLAQDVGALSVWPFESGIDDAGNAFFFWVTRAGNLESASFTVANGWAAGPQVFGGQRGIGSPSLAVAPDGRAVVAWTQSNGGIGTGIYAMQYSPGEGWSEPAATAPTGNGRSTSSTPVVATSSEVAMVVWNRSSGSEPLQESFWWSTAAWQ